MVQKQRGCERGKEESEERGEKARRVKTYSRRGRKRGREGERARSVWGEERRCSRGEAACERSDSGATSGGRVFAPDEMGEVGFGGEGRKRRGRTVWKMMGGEGDEDEGLP